mmetsp:Transcript_11033/g.12734  ORF Transcript_11033/g.12734 Transcript_11033/m.12734 type:complete len:106 (-) Transcript_11033:1147-1464(-)
MPQTAKMVSPSSSEGGNGYNLVIFKKKKKKKKGKKIEIGIQGGNTNKANDQFSNCNPLRNCENKVPWKTHHAVNGTSKKEADNKNWRNTEHQENNVVLARIDSNN